MTRDIQQQAPAWAVAILGVLREEQIEARGREAIRSPQVMTYALELRRPADLAKVQKLDEALALRLAVESVRVGRSLGRVHVEVALPERWRVALPLAALRPGQGVGVAVGKTTTNAQVGLDLASPMTPHALVAGTTGSGKSVLLQALVTQLARQNTPDELRLVLIDGKAEALRPFARLPHLLHPVCYDPQEAGLLLAWAVAELDRRKHGGWTWRLVLVIDEVAEILHATGGKDGAAAESLRRLAALGRSLGVHVVMSTQYPTGEVLGGSLAKANMPARLVGKVLDAQASSLATGQPSMGANRLAGCGDFLLVIGEAQRLQVALPAPRDLEALPRGAQVGALDLRELTPEGALAAVPASSVPDPLTPAQVAWALARSLEGVPGIGTLKKGLGIGSTKAGRLQTFCNDLLGELEAQGCEVLCPCQDETEA